VVEAPRFTVPCPDGFVHVTRAGGELGGAVERAQADDGIVLVLDGRPQAEADTTMIMVGAAGPLMERQLTPEGCEEMGAGLSAGLGATDVSTELIAVPAGPGCRFTGDRDGATIEISTIHRGLESLAVFCSYMGDNPRAPGACRTVREGLVYTAEERVRGRDFSIPIPAGFQILPPGLLPEEIQGGRTTLMGLTIPPYPEPFASSIIAERVPGASLTFPDPEACALIAETTAEGLDAWVLHGVPGLPAERACSVVIESAQPHRRDYWLLLDREGGNYSIVCNVDYRDDRAKEACEEVIAGFRVEALTRDEDRGDAERSAVCETDRP